MKLSVRLKLVGSFLLVILLTAVVGLSGIRTNSNMNTSFGQISNNWMPKGLLIKDINLTVANHRIWEAANVQAATLHDKKAMAEYSVKISSTREQFSQQMSRLKGMLVTEQEKQLYNGLAEKWRAYVATSDHSVVLVTQNKPLDAFAVLRTTSRQTYLSLGQGLTDLNKLNSGNVKNAELALADQYNDSRALNIALLIGAVVTGLAAALYLSGSIAKNVGFVTATAMEVAQGNLAVEKLRIKSRDEIGDMAKAVNTMVEHLRELVQTVSSSVQEIVTAGEELSATSEETSHSAQEVAKAVDEVAKGTGNQASSVNEAVQSVGQLASAVDQIASGATQQSESVNETNKIISQMVQVIQEVASSAQAVSMAAENTSQAAKVGEEAVVKTVDGMERIKKKVFDAAQRIKNLGENSKQIGEIIQVIDDIAEQTNLLALNAAIEAARAGEHGKGFAVVADEVRKLAERSSKATKEIADLITGIQSETNEAVKAMEDGTKEVETGAELAQNAGLALEQIISTVTETYEQTQNISAAAQEMAASSGEVVKAVEMVAQVTEANTAATHQISASSAEVSGTMESIAAVTEQNSAAIEQVSASSEHISAATEQISESAESLSKMVIDLQSLIVKFRL